VHTQCLILIVHKRNITTTQAKLLLCTAAEAI
jgi:hypothetical protein